MHVKGSDTEHISWSVDTAQGQYGHIVIDPVTGQWQYLLDNSNSQTNALSEGEQQSEQFIITATDNNGHKASSIIAVEVEGSNDLPTISGMHNATINSAGNIDNVSGTLTSSDPDHHDQSVWNVEQPNGKFGQLSINPDTGEWQYHLDNQSSSTLGLHSGQQASESFTVTATDSSGTPVSKEVTIVVIGKNEAAVISGVSTGSITEDKNLVTQHLSVTGQLSVTDTDTGESHFQASSLQGQFGHLVINELGHWTYTADNTQTVIQELKTGESLTDTLLVHSVDGTEQRVTVTINGTDDKAVIGNIISSTDNALNLTAPTPEGETFASLKEDFNVIQGELHAEGQLSISDLDKDQAHFQTDVLQGQFGTLSINNLGHWTYTADNSQQAIQGLKTGESLTDTLIVHSVDGTEQKVTVTINGTGDKAVISGTSTAQLTEDKDVHQGQLHTDGALSVTDVDNGQNQFQANVLQGQFGTLSINELGHWIYTADNSQTAIQGLKTGETVTDTVLLHSVDGTEQKITVTINGTDDKALIAGTSTASLTEDKDVHGGQLRIDGALTVTDLDGGQSQFTATSLQGQFGTLSMNNLGHWTYTADNSQPAIQGLKTGESLTDTLIVHSVDGTEQKISVTINGTDDKAVISGTSSAQLTEDKDVHQGQLHVDGALTVTDLDNGQAQFSAESLQGQFGTLSINNLGHWTYTADNLQPSIQGLKTGESVTDTVLVHSIDGTEQKISVTINGTDDKAVIGGTSTASLTEDKDLHQGQLHVDGALTVTDVDNGQNQFQANVLQGQFGTLSINNLGHWTYTADNSQQTIQGLKTGESLTDTLVVHSVDGTEQKISVTINGTDDKAVIAGTSTAQLTEDKNVHQGQLHVDGALTVTDVDNGQNQFQATVQQGQLGSLSLNELGHWTYTADNSQSVIQGLKTGESLTDTLIVHSVDGTEQKISVTINGTDDKAVITGTSTAQLTEDKDLHQGQLHVDGALTVTDVDAGENQFQAIVQQGQFGSLSINDLGHWTYTADNSQSVIQGLKTGESLTDTLIVHSVDGTEQKISVTINGTDDKAVITGTSTAQLTEDKDLHQGQLHVDGALTVTDVDAGENQFQATVQQGQFGSLSINDLGHWTYTADNTQQAIQGLKTGESLTDTLLVHSVDGTEQKISVTINGTDDKAVIGGTATASLTEDKDLHQGQLHTDGALSVTDVDNGQNQFQANVLQGQFGTLSINNLGHWTYTADNSQSVIQGLKTGESLTDTLIVHSVDGTEQKVTVTINGTDDKAVIGGTSSAQLTEDKDVHQGQLHADGALTVTDLDNGQAQFSATSLQGQFGTLSINNLGHWTYTADNLQPNIQGLKAGESLTDTLLVHSVDGTEQKISVTINGTDDKAVISGTSTAQLTEDKDVHQGQLHVDGALTVTDVDAGQNQFQASVQQGQFGSLSLNELGHWTYTADNSQSAIQGLKTGELLTDTLLVHSVDGTEQKISVTINGTDDKAVISGTATASLTEDKDVHSGQLRVDGALTVTDVDNGQNQFQASVQQGQFGSLSLNELGHWTYTADNSQPAIQGLKTGESVTDTVLVHSVDGTEQKVTVTINGTDDKAVIGGTSSAQLTEDKDAHQGQLHVDGALTVTDVDAGQNQFQATVQQGQFGSLSLNELGHWTYTADNSQPAIQGLKTGESLTDTLVVHSVDGTEQKISVIINGADDKALITGTSTADVNEGHGSFGNMSPDYAQPGMAKLGQSALTADGKLNIVDPDTGESQFDPKGGAWNNSYHGQYGHLLLNSDGTWHYDVTVGSVDWVGNRKTTIGSTIDKLGEGQTLTDTITIQSKDGTVHDIVITIHGDNDRPYISSEVTLATSTEDTALTFTKADLLTNTVDVDANDAGKLSIANLLVDHGSVVDNKDGTYTFTPTKDYNGKVHFSYDVQDAHGGVTHTGASSTLTATPDGAIISEVTTEHAIEDGPHSRHNAGVTTELANGQLQVIDPDSGEDKFQYSQFGETAIHDPFGGMLRIDSAGNWGYSVDNAALQHLAQGQTETVVYRVNSYDGTAYELHIDVVGTNDAPTVSQVALSNGTEDTHYQMQASQFGFTDIDTGDTLHSIAITDLPPATQGKFLLNGHDITSGQSIATADIAKLQFVPAQDFNGDIQFKYTVNDGHTDSTEATNTLHFDAVADAAVITGTTTGDVDEGHGTYHDRSPNYAQPGMAKLTNDPLYTDGKLEIIDPDTGESQFDTKGVGYSYHGTYGQLILNTDGNWHYKVTVGSNQKNVATQIDQLGEGQKLTDTITVYSKDGTAQNIVITIHGDNDRPYCSSEVQLNAGTEDTRQTITTAQLLQNSVDVDKNDSGLLTVANLHLDHGSILDNKDGTYTFTPEKDYNGQVHFSYDVKDAHGGVTHTGATTSLSAVRDAAIITEVTSENITEDGANGSHNQGITTELANGRLQVVDPDSGENSFQYSQFGETRIHDPFNGHLRIDSAGNWGYSVDNANLQHLAEGQTEVVTYRVHSKDGTPFDLNINVVGTNDAPVANIVTLSNGTEDTHYQMQASQFGFGDIDSGDTLHSIAITDLPPTTEGKFVLDGHDITAGQSIATADISKLQFIPAKDFNGDVQFKYTVNDGHVDSAKASNTLHITATDDASVIGGDTQGNVDEANIGDTTTATGQLTITDVDTGQNPTFVDVASTATTYGHIEMHNGQWTYTLDESKVQQLDPDESAVIDHHTFIASDGSKQTVDITIKGTNDKPIIESAHAAPAGTSSTLKLQDVDIISNPTGANIDVAATDSENVARWGTDITGVGSGVKLVGLYKPGSDHNWITTPAITSTSHSGTGGYNRVDNHDWWHTSGIPDTVNTGSGGASGHGNVWSGGIVVFEDSAGHQTIGIINRVCTGGGSEVDYLYYHSYQNLHPGGTAYSGSANPGETINVMDGTSKIASVVADSNGHWEVAASQLNDGEHTLHVENSAGQHSAETVFQVNGHAVKNITPAGLNTELKEDSAQTTIDGELRTTDVDHGDTATITAQANHATQYGHFSIDANGQYHYTLDNNNQDVNHLGVHQTLTEIIPVTSTSTDGTSVTTNVTITIQGSVDQPILNATAPDAQKGSSMALNLDVATTDTGGDNEDLLIKISGLPDAATLNHGTHDAIAKMWVLHQSDLKGLELDLHDANFHGDLHFNVTATASSGGESESTTKAVTLFVNSPPEVSNSVTGSKAEDSGMGAIDLLHGATDVDSGEVLSVGDIQYQIGAAGQSVNKPDFLTLGKDGHTLVINANAAEFQHLSAGENETITVSYNVKDSHGGQVAQNATITITGTDDTAQISGHISTDQRTHMTEDVRIQPGGHMLSSDKMTLQVTDPDSSQNYFIPTGATGTTDAHSNGAWVSGDNNIGQFILHASGEWYFKADSSSAKVNSLAEGEKITDTITVHSADGTQQQLTAAVYGTNDAPTVTSIVGNEASLGTTAEDTAMSFTEAQLLNLVGAADIDTTDTLHIGDVSIDPAQGAFAKQPDGSWTFTPAADYSGSQLPLTIQVNDGSATTTAHASINVSGVADAPSISVSLGAVPLASHTDSSTQILDTVDAAFTDDGRNAYQGDVSSDFWVSKVALVSPDGIDPHLITGINVDGKDYSANPNFVPTYLGGGVEFPGLDFTTYQNAQHISLVFASGAPKSMDWCFVAGQGDDYTSAGMADSVTSICRLTLHVDREVSTGTGSTYQTAEVTEDSVIDLHITVASPDSSEDLSVSISGLPSGSILSAGTDNHDGTWTVQQAELSGLTLAPPEDYSGQLNLTVTAISTDGTDVATTDSDLRINITPVAETSTLTGSDISVDEDSGAVALGINLNIHADASETQSLLIEGVPASASLSAGTKNADGSWTLTPAQLQGLTVTPEAQWSGTMALHITATSTEQTGEQSVSSTNLNVHINPVVDMVVTSHDVHVTPTDMLAGIAVPIGVSSLDTSETFQFSVTIPSGWHIKDSSGTWDSDDTQVGHNGNQLNTIKVIPPDGFKGSANIEVHVTGFDGSASHDFGITTSTVTVDNTPPAVTATAALPVDLGNTAEDTSISFSEADLLQLVGATDVNHDSLTITDVDIDAASGTFAKQPDGSWLLTPSANVHGDNLAVTLKVSDGTEETTAHGTLDISSVTDKAAPQLVVSAEQQVMDFAAHSASGVVNTDTLSAGGAMHALTVDMTILGGTQVASTGTHGATLISYGTPSDSNHMYIWNAESGKDLTFRVGGHEYNTAVPLATDGLDHRYTFSWDGQQGTLDVLIDGQLAKHMDGVGKGAVIQDGGKFALGNDQDSFGGGFSTGDAFTGKMFNVAIAKDAIPTDQLQQAPLSNLLDGDARLLTDIRMENGKFNDATGNYHYQTVGSVTGKTVEVDTAIASPNPGATLKLAITPGAPVDQSDHVTNVSIKGFVVGTVLTDGHSHSHTVTRVSEAIDLQGWDQAHLSAQLPAGSTDNMHIVTMVETTGPDGAIQIASSDSTVILDPTKPTPNAIIGGDTQGNTDEVTSITGQLTITDTDPSQAHFVAQVLPTANGEFTVSESGQWSFTPNSTAQTLTQGNSATEIVTVKTIDGTEQQLSVTLVGSDTAPTSVVTDLGQAEAGGPHLIQATELLANVTDVDTLASGLSIVDNSLSSPHGTFTTNADGSFNFVANAGFVGNDLAINFKVTDGHNQVDAKAIIDVVPPLAITRLGHDTGVSDSDFVTCDGHLVVYGTGEPGATIMGTGLLNGLKTTVGQDGQWQLDASSKDRADGTWTLVIFEVKSDGSFHKIQHSVTIDTAKPTIAIEPISKDDWVDHNEHLQALTVSGTCTHVTDGDNVDITLAGQHYSAIVNNNHWQVVIPAAETASISDNAYQVHAEVAATATGDTASTERNIIVSADLSTLVQTAATAEDTKTAASGSLFAIGGSNTVTSIGVQHGNYGTLQINADGSYQYTLDNNHSDIQQMTESQRQADNFFVTYTNPHGDIKHAVLNVGIHGTNDAPILTGTFEISRSVTTGSMTNTHSFGYINIEEMDKGDTLSYEYIDSQGVSHPLDFTAGHSNKIDVPGIGNFNIDADGRWDFTFSGSGPERDKMEQDIASGKIHTESVQLKVTDSAGASREETLTVHIGDGKTGPQIFGASESVVTEDKVTQSHGLLDLLVNDVKVANGVTWSLQPSTQPLYGDLTLAADGSWQYQAHNNAAKVQALAEGERLEETIMVTATDGHGHSVDQAMKLVIIGTNDVPVVAHALSSKVIEDHLLTLNKADLLANVEDKDGLDKLDVSQLQLIGGGSIVQQGEHWVINPGINFNGNLRLTYQVSDGHVAIDNAMSIHVSPDADTPTMIFTKHVGDLSSPLDSFAIQGNENTDLALNINVASPDSNETLSVEISGLPSGASLSAGSEHNGIWTLQQNELTNLKVIPDNNYHGHFSLSVTASSHDGNDSASVQQHIDVDVLPTPQAPVSQTMVQHDEPEPDIDTESIVIVDNTPSIDIDTMAGFANTHSATAPIDHYLNMVGISQADIAPTNTAGIDPLDLPAVPEMTIENVDADMLDVSQGDAFENPLDDEHHQQHKDELLTDLNDQPDQSDTNQANDDDLLHQALNDMHNQV
ncbi:VCBS domain-containing protein [Shewanella sp. 2_MG-2023]|uniref:VCBS domain-containing protein n=1 Tax=Shewanella sp. 2_MG-2023 TaxID=3062630 RepID=UPI0026E1C135|nr:VCBS domain-containing protein [Shewanella sp. 2_MG-2023]MDO6770893.1 VCBS domain-containing protein [Shewanella sp. 2_MG-2023]